MPLYSRHRNQPVPLPRRPAGRREGVLLSTYGPGNNPEHAQRLERIHARLVEARRELDALIGDAYLRPRASIVPVHFLDLASAAEKLRWAEKEWRELDREIAAGEVRPELHPVAEEEAEAEEEPHALVDSR